jgi:hypothetical protein
MPMILRSGKVVTVNARLKEKLKKPKTNCTKSVKCSYCNQLGHKINKCNDDKIKELDEKLIERTLFSHIIIPTTSMVKRHLRFCLCSLPEKKLLMLCYKNNVKKYCTDLKKISYINVLSNYYYELSSNTEIIMLIDMLDSISDENYEKYTNEIIRNSSSLGLTFQMEEIILQQVYRYRHIQRKFNIQIITNEENPEEEEGPQSQSECPICYETYSQSEIIHTECSHNYCKDCLTSYLKSLNDTFITPTCAYCRKVITILEIKNKNIREEIQKKYCKTTQEQIVSF